VKKSSAKRVLPIASLKLVAAKAGVSRATVSHILGGKLADRYRDETRAKVEKIAAAMNYRPHRGAQVMKSGRSNLIAIVHFGADIEAARKTNLALSRLTSQNGFDYLAIDMNWYGGCVERTLEEILRARAEGVLISHIQEVIQNEHIAEIQRAGIPVISVNGGLRSDVPRMSDNLDGAFFDLTSHLLQSGHRRIVQPATPIQQPFTEAFRRAIDSRGKWIACDQEGFFESWPSLCSSGADEEVLGITVRQQAELWDKVDTPVYKFCRRLFQARPLPDAIVCRNDMHAMEVIAAGLECGVRVPEDVAVTGYDNDGIGAFPAFAITTAEQDTEAICSAAVEALMRQIASPGSDVPSRVFDSKLILRSSSGASSSGRQAAAVRAPQLEGSVDLRPIAAPAGDAKERCAPARQVWG
jgi:LacI family transcriptional regulator